VWNGQLAQLEPQRAREMAWILLEAASAAEAESALVRFLLADVNAKPDEVMGFVQDLRRFRSQMESESGSLVGQKVDG